MLPSPQVSRNTSQWMLSSLSSTFVGQPQTGAELRKRLLELLDPLSRSEVRVPRRCASAWRIRSRARRSRVLTLLSEMSRVLAVSEMLSSCTSRRMNTCLLREDNRLRALRIALRTCVLSQTWKGFSRGSTISVRSVWPSPSSWSRDSCLNLRLALNHIRASLMVMLISQVRNCESCRNWESLLKALRTAFCAMLPLLHQVHYVRWTAP